MVGSKIYFHSEPEPLNQQSSQRRILNAGFAPAGHVFYGCTTIAIAINTSACAVTDGREVGAVASSEHALRSENGLMLRNGLRFDNGLRLLDGELLEHGLAVGHGLSIEHGLSTEAGLSSTSGFLTSAAGQELIMYLVECTLPLGRAAGSTERSARRIQRGVVLPGRGRMRSRTAAARASSASTARSAWREALASRTMPSARSRRPAREPSALESTI
jgi:hypothetical protein